MASKIPKTMQAIALTRFCNPTEYNLGTLPVPEITGPDELLIRVRAASVNPVDVKLASSYVYFNLSVESTLTYISALAK
jgi:NADPH:quinone reductase-like Zn-dependent oxidoreductase